MQPESPTQLSLVGSFGREEEIYILGEGREGGSVSIREGVWVRSLVIFGFLFFIFFFFLGKKRRKKGEGAGKGAGVR